MQSTEISTTYKTGWYVGRDKLTNREFAFKFERGAFWVNNGLGKPVKMEDHARYAPFEALVKAEPVTSAAQGELREHGPLCQSGTMQDVDTFYSCNCQASEVDALTAERDRADRAEARIADVNATVEKFAGRNYDAEVQQHGDPEYWRGAEHAQDYIVHRLRTALGNAEATV